MTFNFLVAVEVPDAWANSVPIGDGRKWCESYLANRIDKAVSTIGLDLPRLPGFTNSIEVAAIDLERDGEVGEIGDVRPYRRALT